MGSSSYPVFSGCTNLKTINIGNNVKTIPSYAFYGCTGLTSVTIPNSVTLIGEDAFFYCSSLTSVTIPNSVISIGSSAFYGCTGLISVVNGKSVTSIGSSAFDRCTNLKVVINLSNLTFIEGSSDYGCIAYYANQVINDPNVSIVEDFAFSKVNNINRLVAYLGNATELILPTDFNGENYEIGFRTFAYCKGLTSVIIPNSVTKIGEWAFYECEGLTEVNIYDLSAWCRIDFGLNYANPMYYAKKLKLNGTEIKDLVIPNNITQIKDYAFYSCTGLTSVTIPNSVTKIGDHAFSACYGLTSVSIPNSVTEIGGDAFCWCTGLTSVTIPNSVTSIGSDAFESCGIRLIMCHCAVPPTCGSDAFGGEIDSYSALLMIPEGSLIDYALADEWHKFTQVHEVSEAKVSTEEKSATFEIPTIEGATEYLASVYSDATMSQLVATTHYDAYGKITPMSTSLELSIDGFDDGVYYYKVLVKSATGEILKNYIGTFEIDAAGIENIATDDAVEVSRYDIHGRLLSEPTRGINIVIYSDGTTRKEIIKE